MPIRYSIICAQCTMLTYGAVHSISISTIGNHQICDEMKINTLLREKDIWKVKIKHLYIVIVFSHDPTTVNIYICMGCAHGATREYIIIIVQYGWSQRERERNLKNQSVENEAWLLSLVQLKKCNHALNDFNSLIVCAVQTQINTTNN